jgi:predicted phosphodiesterase
LSKNPLLSDTHIDDTILKYVALADEVWHAGDIDLAVTDLKKIKPLRAVYGNIDDAKAHGVSVTQPFYV